MSGIQGDRKPEVFTVKEAAELRWLTRKILSPTGKPTSTELLRAAELKRKGCVE